ncbi:MAG: hypothetical protein SPD81_01755 [Candidatus Faecousia sp.]|nr:hypothetical protein [Candidatus Faecousia sp.]
MSTKNVEVPFLPQPRKIVANGDVCKVSGEVVYSTNMVKPIRYDFLLGMAGMVCVQKCDIATDDLSVLYVVLGTVPEVLTLRPDSDDEEAYAVCSTADSIVIAANTEKGISLGVKLIVKLQRSGMLSTGVLVQDHPDVHFRGVHMEFFRPNDGTEKDSTTMEDVRRRLIVAALSNYNYTFLQFWGMFPFRNQPGASWPEAYTWDEIQALIDFIIEDLHMTPCPTQNLVSHAAWSRLVSRQHVMLDQHPERADLYIQGGWCFTTERPQTKAFLMSIMDDLIEIFHTPPFFHVSADKCFGFGSEEEDRVIPSDILFIKHLCFLHDYLSKKGVRMVMWTDMLYSSMDTMLWKCDPTAANYLPKDILMNIWTHNDPGDYWADIDFFESKGFQTIYAPFFNKAGAGSMVKLCKQHGSLGIMQTTWHRPELALPTIVYTGGIEWGPVCGDPADEAKLNQIIALYKE